MVRKSQEVHSTTLNLAITYIGARSTPNVYSMTGLQEKTESIRRSQKPCPFPALHAGRAVRQHGLLRLRPLQVRSEPGRVLVELLQFIDLDPSDLEGGQNPIDVLGGRRPISSICF